MDDGFPVWLRLVVAILASWRITHLLANEDGPGGLVARLRLQLGRHWLGSLMDCFGCLGLWVAALFVPYVAAGRADQFVSWFGIAGGAFLLQRCSDKPLSLVSTPASEPEN